MPLPKPPTPKTPKPLPLRILLSGAGITTNTLAYFLTRQGHHLTILERAPTLRDTGLQVDLRGPGVEVIRRMGLESALKAKTIREEGFQVVDEWGRRRAWFPVERDESSSTSGGERKTTLTTEWEVMRGDLCRLLYEATLSSQGQGEGKGKGQGQEGELTYRFNTSIEDLQERTDGVDVRFSNGEQHEFDLVIGGDGQNSKVRELLVAMRRRRQQEQNQNQHTLQPAQDAEIVDPFKPLGVYAGLFTTSWPLEPSPSPTSSSSPTQNEDTNSPLLGTIYIAPRKRAIFTRRHRPDRTQIYLFCRTDDPAFAALRRGHLDPDSERALLMRHFRDAGWEADRIMRALQTAEDFYCERIGFVRMEDGWSSLVHPTFSSGVGSAGEGVPSAHGTDTGSGKNVYTGGRIVLVGDAAYAPSVTTGMGTTAGVVGAYVLAGEIGKYCLPGPSSPSSLDSPPESTSTSIDGLQTAILNYERTLRPFIQYLQKDLSEGSSAWDRLPETRFGVGVWNAMLSVSSWLRLDSFGRWVRDDKGAGWRLPEYEATTVGSRE